MDENCGDSEPAAAQKAPWSETGTESGAGRGGYSGSGERPFGLSGPGFRSTLLRVIEGEIIPGLFTAQNDPATRALSEAAGSSALPAATLDRLARHALRGEADQISEELASLREQFSDYEQIHSVFFGPLSHHILNMYKNELCEFEEMILAMCLIERLVHDDSQIDDAVNQGDRRKYP